MTGDRQICPPRVFYKQSILRAREEHTEKNVLQITLSLHVPSKRQEYRKTIIKILNNIKNQFDENTTDKKKHLPRGQQQLVRPYPTRRDVSFRLVARRRLLCNIHANKRATDERKILEGNNIIRTMIVNTIILLLLYE